jgi:HemY protein
VIRAGLVLTVAALLVIVVAVLVGHPGTAAFTWLGWEVQSTAAAAVLLIIFGALFWVALWRTLVWIVEAPRRAERDRQDTRRRQGADALTRGFLAAAAGDGAEANRLARKATLLAADDAPALARILAARAAEATGDLVAAQAAYSAMLGFPDERLAAHRGLMQAALAQGDKAVALRHAEAAFALSRTTLWAWRALLEARLQAGDWNGALELVERAVSRKVASPMIAQRTRAALLAASAASLQDAPDPKLRSEALVYACQAAKLQPDFAPGVVMAARLLQAEGKAPRAAGLIESAWKAAPHPALWLAYRDLNTAERPAARAERLRRLAALHPDHRESRILMVEQALISRDAESARAQAKGLNHAAPAARELALMARVADLAGDKDEARAFINRARGAPIDPDWSDLDPEGRAFAYAPADWARLVSTYAETGELIHPRLERRERVITDLPDLPMSYEASTSFLAAAEAGAALMPAPVPRG